MFFAHTARVLAALGFILSAINIGLAVAIVSGSMPPEAVQRYGPYNTTGEMLDENIYRLIFCVALGTIAEIALTLKRRPVA